MSITVPWTTSQSIAGASSTITNKLCAPTNGWYSPFISGGGGTVAALPYNIRSVAGGLQISNPAITVDSVGQYAAFTNDLNISLPNSSTVPQVVAGDAFSVSLQVSGATMYITRGDPFITVLLNNTSLTISGTSQNLVTAGKYTFTSGGKSWLCYTTAPLSILSGSTGYLTTGNYTGTLRFALQPTAGLSLLDTAINTWVIPGNTTITYTTTGYTVLFKTNTGLAPLLCYLSYLHTSILGVTTPGALTYSTVRGTMNSYTANPWTFSPTIHGVGWDCAKACDPTLVTELQTRVTADLNNNPWFSANDMHNGSKLWTRTARLILISQNIGMGMTPQISYSLNSLRVILNSWLSSTNGDPLQYDTVWGGIMPQSSMSSVTANRGSGTYTNHLAQIGHVLYAAATVARYDQTWAANNSVALLSLVANTLSPVANSAFTSMRHFDHYEMHSWSTGLSTFAGGNLTESSSENVFGYYATQLLGTAMLSLPGWSNFMGSGISVADLAKTICSAEVAGVQAFYHVSSTNPVYAAPFNAKKLVGQLWSEKAAYANFDSSDESHIRSRHIIPITPISEFLFSNSTWVAEHNSVYQSVTPLNQGLQGFQVAFTALTNKSSALATLRTMTGQEAGNSTGNMLYWIATR